MNEEEKKTIEKIKLDMSKPLACKEITICDVDDLMKLLNLIDRQEKKIKSLENDNQVLKETLYGGNVSN